MYYTAASVVHHQLCNITYYIDVNENSIGEMIMFQFDFSSRNRSFINPYYAVVWFSSRCAYTVCLQLLARRTRSVVLTTYNSSDRLAINRSFDFTGVGSIKSTQHPLQIDNLVRHLNTL